MFGFDTTDLTSTTTRSLDLESMLDGQSDSEGDISTTDARTIRKQLEGLESMYSEVQILHDSILHFCLLPMHRMLEFSGF